MNIIDPGHTYQLAFNKSEGVTELRFMKDSEHNEGSYEGTSNQEVLRALIDRILFLNRQKSSEYNQQILKHLRSALVLHECRHLEREVDKCKAVEQIPITATGHIIGVLPTIKAEMAI